MYAVVSSWRKRAENEGEKEKETRTVYVPSLIRSMFLGPRRKEVEIIDSHTLTTN